MIYRYSKMPKVDAEEAFREALGKTIAALHHPINRDGTALYVRQEARNGCAYLRSAAENDAAIQFQRERITALAALAHITIPEHLWFVDNGIDGLDPLADRPDGRRLLQAVHGGGINCLLVDRQDRISRDIFASETLRLQLSDLNVQVFTCQDWLIDPLTD